MEKSFELICRLAENFKTNEKAYLAPAYSESRVRQDFIDKFFTALGWDVTHAVQTNPFEQEVKIENNVNVSGSQRRADYAFAIAPNYDQIKFFVEAKKPSRSLANNDDYFQAIRYAWNTRTPIAVLTDFEEFHILDCRYKPNIKNAIERRVSEFRYTDYADKEIFAKIFHLFGKKAVASGSLEKYAAALPKKGTKHSGVIQPVDDAFLEELDGYRETLAKAFKKTNPQLQGEALTEAVQRTIDRLVFIRFLEDKGIEEKQIVTFHNQQSSWQYFISSCKRFDAKYNGLIFKPHRILDSGAFNSPDEHPFADICQKLSDPASPYDFNQIPISILGSIYERFLGKVVHATDKRVKVEEKPEVRKAGGVVYTPEYIVKYIVKETVGKIIEGKTPEEIALMAFADIACGSGSFLIQVYALLLDYHLRYYSDHPESAGSDALFERDGKKYLTLKKKKEILTNNVYGVDIDFQATEVTQLSLYLKMLENATTNDAFQFSMFKESILPDLRQNIVCGNSLIGRDILDGDLFSTIDEAKLKPMNYEDVFPKVMGRGGFDTVVGNPPYGAELSELQNKYLENSKLITGKTKESYSAFVLKALRVLKKKGLMSYILPSAWTGAVDFVSFRSQLMQTRIEEIILLPFDIFKDAYIDTLILALSSGIAEASHQVKVFVFPKKHKLTEIIDLDYNKVNQLSWASIDGNKIVFDQKTIALIEKLRLKHNIMDDFIEVKRGVLFDKSIISPNRLTDEYREYFTGDVYRYQINLTIGGWIPFNDKLKERPKELKWFEGPRILLRRLVNRQQRMMASYTNKSFITNKNLYSLLIRNTEQLDYYYVLGLINSKLISYLYLSQVTQATKDDFPQVTIRDMQKLPFPLTSKDDQLILSDFIIKRLDSAQKLIAAITDADVHRYESLCEMLDRKIDEAVYGLYGLTEEEIKIVEGN